MAETEKGGEKGVKGVNVSAGKLAINMQKRLTRAQEKVMQKLGKADETRDTAFEEGVGNFSKQMTEGARLQKDLKAYLVAVKTMHEASKRLQDCLADMYEPDWFGKEEVDSIAEEMIEKEMDNCLEDTDMLWIDFHQKLVDSAIINLDNYMAQFPDIKNRIAKRDRKLVDFDSARHHMASIQKGKKKDEVKIAKPVTILEKAAPGWAQGMIAAHQVAQTNLSRNQAEEELGRAQKVFEEINAELQEELPALWNSRVGLYVTTFQSMAGVTEKFHKEMGKLSQNLNDVMGKLEDQRNIKTDSKTKATAKSEAAANHRRDSDSIPSPSKPELRRPSGPPVPRPPRPSPSREVPQQDKTPEMSEDNATVATATPSPTPDVTLTAPSQPEQPTAAEPLQDDHSQPAQDYQQPSWDDQDTGTANQPAWDDQDPANQAGWDDQGPQGYTQEQTWDDAGQGQGNDDQQTWDDAGQGQAYDDQQQTWDDSEGGQAYDDTQQTWDEQGAEQDYAQQGWGDDGQAQAGWGDPGADYGDQPDSSAASGAESNAVTNGSSDGGDLPTGVLYKVKALHDYAATDGDELEMKAGEVVYVVAFDNPDEQDEGWLLGVKESHWLANKNLSARGVFPENFTQRC